MYKICTSKCRYIYLSFDMYDATALPAVSVHRCSLHLNVGIYLHIFLCVWRNRAPVRFCSQVHAASKCRYIYISSYKYDATALPSVLDFFVFVRRYTLPGDGPASKATGSSSKIGRCAPAWTRQRFAFLHCRWTRFLDRSSLAQFLLLQLIVY